MRSNDVTTKKSVTVIGLGPMGQASARAYLAAGYDVTVWNRTASKADGVVAEGAKLAGSVEEALRVGELVILSLTDYDAMYAILEPAADALAGTVVVNLSSDTPERSREGAAWAEKRGARYIAGGFGVSPAQVGTPEGFAYYSGPEELVEAHRPALEVLARVDYMGADPGLAPLWYQLQLGMFWSSFAAYLHTLAVANANGITAEELLPYAADTADSVSGFLKFYTPRLQAGSHEGDVDRLSMGVASVEHVTHTARDSGVDTALPEALLSVFRRGIEAGFADRSATSLLEVFKGAGPVNHG
ncbi:NAD(P)-dependent oxidoreductase [Streptomyces sp. TRM66268-LWL]|uniref:NAD(P)-dependent oxidoreductase n=1 Tax=Streptomyces polyasparticus TaxID=2767826 RepID=A0ABR7SA93_9ACTN|nr:NAD(P)-binding domain-containing protein [Streptomyces polyasparticus]MBC9711263.1 NAD(P)-dependent oxidoreductase [Streptomyces polyasparticus]